jgi:acyl carrier protein
MTRAEIEAKVLDIIREQKGPPPEGFTPRTPLAEAGIDSLDALSILFSIEETFSISIPDERARAIATLDDMVSAIEELIPA